MGLFRSRPLSDLVERLQAPLEYGPRQERAALAFLAGDGCPACALAAESEARWLKYFVVQGWAEPEVFEKTRASLGPCGRHRRLLVAARGGVDVYAATAVFLAREAMKRAGTGHVPAQCHPCEREAWAEDHAIDTLLRTLHRPPVAERLTAVQGFCLPHLLKTLARALPPGVAVRLAGLGSASLAQPPGAALRARLCGRDEDAPARVELLRAAALPERTGSLHAWVGALLEVDDCPVCLAERVAARGALGWAGAGAEHEAWELRFCPGHLATLGALDPAAADRAAAVLSGEWSGALSRYAEAMARSRGLGKRGDRAAARSKLLANRACRACDVQRSAGERTLALLDAALRDRTLSETYARSHGVCWRHLSSLPVGTREGVAGETLRARLSLLHWELEEAQRKRSWSIRWETAGAEAGAWRALSHFVGDPGGRDGGWDRTNAGR